jgi:ADP-ribose pyrophosphatase YjhB (NUDIX family)
MKLIGFPAFLRPLEPVARRGLHVYWRFSRGLTLGVRGLVLDKNGRVFLVKHSYVAGWHLPGGGVEPGETLIEALAREMREEGNIELTRAPELYGMYFNPRDSRRDHVALFVIDHFRQPAPPKPDHEITAHGFFPLTALPEETTRATRARIDEVVNGAKSAERW